MFLKTVNPATEKLLQLYPETPEDELQNKLSSAQQTFFEWRYSSWDERATLMYRLAKALEQNKTQLSLLITEEMGKPIIQSQLEVDKCIFACQHYAENAAQYLKPRVIETDYQKSFVSYQPLGVIFAITPWNFPLWQVFRFTVPTLMAGNSIVLKHAPNTTGSGLAVEKLIHEAGFPKNLFQTIVLNNERAESLIQHSSIAGVAFTGSQRTGQIIARLSGAALKKVVLELGGNDPYIVMADADIDLAVKNCVASRLHNAGQVCVSAKRMIVHQAVYKEFKEKLIQAIKPYQFGDPKEESTLLGPLARQDLRETVHKQVQMSIKSGALLLQGGQLPSGAGYYYPVTVLENVYPGCNAFDEEIFGPVIALTCAENDIAALKLANQSAFGLSGAIFSKNIQYAEKLAIEQLDVGFVAINTLTASDPRLPFGGTKASGLGRELSLEGIQAFTNIKTIVVI